MAAQQRQRAPAEPPYKPTPEEIAVLDTCTREVLWWASVGATAGALTAAALLTPLKKLAVGRRRLGVALGALGGLGAGVSEGREVCLERILALENSPLADRVRKHMESEKAKQPPRPSSSSSSSSSSSLPAKDSTAERHYGADDTSVVVAQRPKASGAAAAAGDALATKAADRQRARAESAAAVQAHDQAHVFRAVAGAGAGPAGDAGDATAPGPDAAAPTSIFGVWDAGSPAPWPRLGVFAGDGANGDDGFNGDGSSAAARQPTVTTYKDLRERNRAAAAAAAAAAAGAPVGPRS